MPPIRPKPTRYGDTLFRSRLEARWAVFLDYHFMVNLWVHEPRHFQSEEGWSYTPDFYFSIGPFGYILETKPMRPTEDYLYFLRSVCKVLPDWSLLLGIGDFYRKIPTIQNITTGEPSTPLDKCPFLPKPAEAIMAARNYRFDLPHQSPPQKAGTPGELQARMARWVSQERKRCRRTR